jgi:hypothetical protein
MRILKEDAVLKNGKVAKIFYSNTLTECKATKLILKVSIELIEKGFAIENGISIFNMAEVIWAECDEIPIGGICYYKYQHGVLQNWILLSFTDSEWRGLDVNFICHTELEKLTQQSGINYITSLVHVNNTARIKSCEKVGMKGEFYRMSKKLI